MPSIKPRRNQNGIVTSYRLIVSGGLDREGKQIKRRMLWIPPNRNISDQQMLKEATAAAYKFEEQIKNGYVLDNTQTFAEYAQYVLELKERIGVKTSTGVIVIDCNLLYSANRGIYEDTTKTGAVRAIKIAPQTLTVLRQWRVEYEHLQELNGDRWAGTPYVFVRDDGSRMHPDSITAWLNRFSAQNDLPHIHPHAFRHTAASTMIANGVDLVTTAAELGHANANTTATIYAHQIAIARATAADVRAGVFAGRK